MNNAKHSDVARKLDSTVDMSSHNHDFKSVDSIWKVTAKDVPVQVCQCLLLVVRTVIQSVDRKKLAKAEEKSREKAAKRSDDAPTTRKRPQQIQATASQVFNRRDAKDAAAGLSNMDIRLEGIDISFGTR